MCDASRGGEAWRGCLRMYVCAQGCTGRGMKYYNTSLGNCAAPSSGVYQVSNTLIRKPPLWPPFPVARGSRRVTRLLSQLSSPPLQRHFPTRLRLRMRGFAVSRGEDFLVRRREKLPGCLQREKWRNGEWRGIAFRRGILLNIYRVIM